MARVLDPMVKIGCKNWKPGDIISVEIFWEEDCPCCDDYFMEHDVQRFFSRPWRADNFVKAAKNRIQKHGFALEKVDVLVHVIRINDRFDPRDFPADYFYSH